MRGAIVIAILVAWLCLYATSCAAVEPVRAHLRSQVEVAADKATLADVADLSGDPALIADLAPLSVQELPGAGIYHLQAAHVRMALGRRVPAGRLIITGECILSRAMRTISEADIAAAALASATAGEVATGDLTAAVIKVSGAMCVPDGGEPARLVAEAVDRSALGEVPFRVRAMQGDNELARTLVMIRLTRTRLIPVAVHAIRRGDIFNATDVRLERKPALRGDMSVAVLPADFVGQIARADIADGMPLNAHLFQPRSDVHAGQGMSLVYRHEEFELATAGEALGDGQIGDIIQVRRLSDGRAVKARITSSDAAQINFTP